MSNIITSDDIFTKDELDFILSLRNGFKSYETPNRNNYYSREKILDTSSLTSFLEKSKVQFDKINDDKNTQLTLLDVWVNHINSEEEQREDYHIDDCEYTSITFLDDDFEGGDLEISRHGNKTIIEPKVGRTVFFRGIEYPHRVLPVKKGLRHTFVTFWERKSKKENSLF